MSAAKNTFDMLISQGTISNALYQYLESQSIHIDFSDLLRWQWTLAVSALDRYIHDIVRAGMVMEFEGRKNPTPKYQKFRIEMSTYAMIHSSPVPSVEFEQEVERQHSFLAFQYPDKIADALSLIWDEANKWDVIGRTMVPPVPAPDLKTKLKNIVLRRNQIVHEGDCFSLSPPLGQQPISLSDVNDVVSFIKSLVLAIDTCVT